MRNLATRKIPRRLRAPSPQEEVLAIAEWITLDREIEAASNFVDPDCGEWAGLVLEANERKMELLPHILACRLKQAFGMLAELQPHMSKDLECSYRTLLRKTKL